MAGNSIVTCGRGRGRRGPEKMGMLAAFFYGGLEVALSHGGGALLSANGGDIVAAK